MRAVTIAAALALLVVAWVVTPPVSYLGAWLFWAGLAIGALPVLLTLEITGGRFAPTLIAPLRALVRLIPFAAVLLLPVLTRLHPLYPWTDGHLPAASFGQDWLHPAWFVVRSVVYLVIWSLLALVFGAERGLPVAPDRRRRAMLGLGVHAIVGTFAAVDWMMSIDPNWHSGEFGLLVMTGQSAGATAAALLLALIARRELPRGAGTILVITAAIWGYVHFIRYLVTWSGDLPKEVAWYAARGLVSGSGLAWFGFLAGLVIPAGLVLLARRWALLAAALLALTAHLVETMWMVTPSVRGHFVLSGMDILALAALGAIAALLAPVLALSRTDGRLRERAA